MTELHPNRLVLKDGREFRIFRSGFRSYVRDGPDQHPIDEFRSIVASGGGIAFSGAEVIPILKAAAAEEPAWPGPGDTLNELEKNVVELRMRIYSLRDDRPMAPDEKAGVKAASPRAWGFRHAGLCGLASRMGMVDNPKYAASPLLAEAIELRDELLRLAEAAYPKTDYYRAR